MIFWSVLLRSCRICRKTSFSIRCTAGTSKKFSINVEVHQLSVMSSLLFNIVMNYPTKKIMNNETKMKLFADDVVVVSSDEQHVQDSLNSLHIALASNDF